jgi:hypothetical protein
MDLSKLDRTGRAFAVIGLLAFIDAFLRWSSVSLNGRSLSGYPGLSRDAWGIGFLGWFPMVLLLALGVVAMLAAFGVDLKVPTGLGLLGVGVGLLSLILVLIRWVTLPSETDGVFTASWDASYGLFIGLVLCILTMVVGWMGYAARGGSLGTLGQSFGSDRRISDVTPGAASAPAPEAQAPAQSPQGQPQAQAPVQAPTEAPAQAAQAPVQAPAPAAAQTAPQTPAETWQAPAAPAQPAAPPPTTPTEPKD